MEEPSLFDVEETKQEVNIEEINTDIESISAELIELQKSLELSTAMCNLSESKDFDLVFNQHFLKHYRDTACANIGNTNRDGRDNYAVGLAGRSMFEQFCDNIVSAKKPIEDRIKEFESEIKRLKSML